MTASGQRKRSEQSEVLEFVPKKELERSEQQIERQQQQIERLQKENERLKQERERLQRELDAALRASKRTGGATFARRTSSESETAGPKGGSPIRSTSLPAD